MKEISRILVVGAGVMGHGIALVCARSGFQTDLVDVKEEYLHNALSQIDRFLQGSLERGKMTEDQVRDTKTRLTTGTDIRSYCKDVDIVIEAIIEEKEAKMRLFEELNETCKSSAVFASNTSQLSITELGRSSGRPDRFVGMHWFNPPALMRLVEIPRGIETSDETLETVSDLARKLGKEPVVCKDSPGFVVNRVLNVWYNEAMRLLDEGAADAETVDRAIRDGGGFRMGPLQLRDLVGLDTALLITESLYERLGSEKFRPCQCLRDLVAAGHFGRKTGRGFYKYDEDK
ncbi:MAG: 3-hydroxyacyl-CoA dehydrogenase family protein [Deltaproteobacteria bacterium]|nr:3-hydroxyacyl-CoA dehydrogenase family protein [Deltaproteobacteria bacterium]MBW2137230.1 3-hydroxyacyl-CoA dehydrogenase family protein [Deltaproteobacteria bacterium]